MFRVIEIEIEIYDIVELILNGVDYNLVIFIEDEELY